MNNKRFFKKFLSLILSFVLLFTAAPFLSIITAFAESSNATSGTTGDCTWKIKGTVLTISGNGEMENYSESSSMPWGKNSNITRVVVEAGITSIGDWAFYDCTALTDITIPDSVISIGNDSFRKCTSLKYLKLPNSITSIGDAAFSLCAKLNSVYINDLENWCKIKFESSTSNPLSYAHNLYLNGNLVTDLVIPSGITSIGDYAFSGCESIKSITISDSILSRGKGAFDGCKISKLNIAEGSKKITGSMVMCENTLSEVIIPNSVTCIGENAFMNCIELSNISIPSTVTSIENYAFYGCESLLRITIPDSVTSIGGAAFKDCTKLTSIALPNGVTIIEHSTFRGCIRLASVTIPNSVTTIGPLAFYECKKLESIIIPNSVTRIDFRAFEGCTMLTKITMSDSINDIGYGVLSKTGFFSDDNNWENDVLYISDYLISVNSKFAGDYIIKNGTKCIAGRAFYNCAELTGITIPDSVTSIGEEAFSNCTSLKSITIPNSVTTIDPRAFSGCSILNEVHINDLEKWLNIKFFDAFSNPLSYANNLYLNGELITNLVIPDGLTEIGSFAFGSCKSITSITIPNSITSIGQWAFSGCTNLKEVHIDNIENWCKIKFNDFDSNPLSNAHNLYIKGELATNIVIPDSITSIGDYTFYSCESLINITIPSSVTKIGNSSFYGCKSLKNVIVPDSVTDIGSYSFFKCLNITSIKMPNNNFSIGSFAFYGCTNLNKVYIKDIAKWCNLKIDDGYSNPLYYAHNLYLNDELVTNLVIPNEITYIGNNTFSGCTSLKSITIPNNITHIGKSAFYGCTELSAVYTRDIEDWCKIRFENSSSNPLSYAHNLYIKGELATNIVVPDSIINIGDYTFYSCESFINITISDSVTYIGEAAFSGCKNLTIRTVENSVSHKYAVENKIRYYLTRITTKATMPTVESSRKSDENSVTVTIKFVDGYEYRCDDGKWQSSNVFSSLSFGSQYRFYQRLAESEYNVAGPSSESLNVTLKKIISAPNAPELSSKTSSSIILKAVIGYEYSIDGLNWQESNEFGGLKPNHEYKLYQRIAENDVFFASEKSLALTIKTLKLSNYSVSADPEVISITNTIITLKSINGYEFCIDDGEWQNSNVFTGLLPNSTHKFYQRIAETDLIYASERSKELTVTTLKNETIAPYLPEVLNISSNSVTLKDTDGYEYKMDNDEWQSSNEFTRLAPNSTHKFYQRIAETETSYASESSEALNVTTLKNTVEQPPVPEVSKKTPNSVTLKQISGYEYKIDNGEWQSSNEFTGLAPNSTHKFYQRIKETETSYVSESSEAIFVEIVKNTVNSPSVTEVLKKTPNSVTLKQISGYEYKMDNGEWQSSNEFTGLAPNSTHKFYQRIAETETSYASESSEALSVTTLKNTVEQPPLPQVLSKTSNSVTLKSTVGFEYSINGTVWQKSNAFTGLKENTLYTFFQRVAETETSYASYFSDGLKVWTDYAYIPGDLDGDEGITDSDVLYLLKHTFRPEKYPVNQPCDYDGDGMVTDADAVYLLKHIFRPDKYPLSK